MTADHMTGSAPELASTSGMKLWFAERFPPVNFISGVMLYILPKCIAHLAGVSAWSWWDFAAALIPGFHLFILRVFDEHKDFATDMIHNPHRVLQRGLFTLREVRRLGLIAGACEVAILVALKPEAPTWLAFAAMWIWTLLMWKEFFIADWLKAHFFWYGLSHLMITPLILVFCAFLAGTPHEFIVALFALGVLTSWIYEVTRKTKAAEEETGDVSYSKMWGVFRACLVIDLQGLLTVAVGAALLQQLQLLNSVTGVVLALVLVLHFASVAKFQKAPSPKGRKSNEGTAALLGFAIFLIPLISDVWRILRG